MGGGRERPGPGVTARRWPPPRERSDLPGKAPQPRSTWPGRGSPLARGSHDPEVHWYAAFAPGRAAVGVGPPSHFGLPTFDLDPRTGKGVVSASAYPRRCRGGSDGSWGLLSRAPDPSHSRRRGRGLEPPSLLCVDWSASAGPGRLVAKSTREPDTSRAAPRWGASCGQGRGAGARAGCRPEAPAPSRRR